MTEWVKKIAIINVIVFLLTSTYEDFKLRLVLYPLQTEFHIPYQWVTHQFCHGNLAHIIFNMLAFISFGPVVEKYFKNKFLWFYLLSGIFAAYLQLYFTPEAALLGASGAVFAVVIVAAILEPDSKILLFFVIPMKARWIVPLVLVGELYMAVFNSGNGVGHVAHLGGALFGFLFYIFNRNEK